jgi:hypothetical protein
MAAGPINARRIDHAQNNPAATQDDGPGHA